MPMETGSPFFDWAYKVLFVLLFLSAVPLLVTTGVRWSKSSTPKRDMLARIRFWLLCTATISFITLMILVFVQPS